ncbi:hypothetical protein [Cerasicoccus maritimus]|nr:hypothetical protein [Cerasicoccus maritimus]
MDIESLGNLAFDLAQESEELTASVALLEAATAPACGHIKSRKQ